MKKNHFFLLVLTIGLIASLSSVAGAPFEGTMRFSLLLKGGNSAEMAAVLPREMKLKIKGEKLRTELVGGLMESMMGIIIANPEKKVNCILNSQVKMAYTLEVEETNNDEAIKAEPTGKKEKIAGYSCEEFIVTAANGAQTVVWITKSLQFPNLKGTKQSGLTRFLNTIPGGLGMPMRISQQVGDSQLTIEVLEVQKEKIPDALFEVPEGYQTAPFNPAMFGGEEGDE